MAGMRRRDFIAAVGSTAVAWPARAQQGERMRRIGVLMNVAENDPAGQRRIAAFLQRLQELDWEEGRNLRIDMRWGAGDSDRYRRIGRAHPSRHLRGHYPRSGATTTRIPHRPNRFRQRRRRYCRELPHSRNVARLKTR
jgi:hypothetical protein